MMKLISLWTVAATLALSQTAMAETKKNDRAKTAASNGSDTPIAVTVTTITLAESTGCWAKIYDGHNFEGRTLTLVGEQSLPNLEFGVGMDWEGDIDSIEVGPKASLTLFEDERYADKKRDLKPGEKVADLHKNIFSEGVESMKLACLDNAAAGQNRSGR